MPPKKVVLSLTQISINSLTKLLVDGLNPQFLSKLKLNHVQSSNINSKSKVIKPSDVDGSIIEETTLVFEDCDKENLCVENENQSEQRTVQEDNKSEREEKQEYEPIQEENQGFETKKEENQGSEKNERVLDPQTELNHNTNINLLGEVEEFLTCLANDLTSHAHCTLQKLLFWSVLAPLNALYIKYSCPEMKKLIRDIVPLFINSTLKALDLGCFKMLTESHMFQAIYSRLHKATGLEKLVFGRCCYWRSSAVVNLGKVLEGMSNLQVLHIHYIAHPDLLQGLPDSCPQLRELSLKGSKLIKDEECHLIAQFKKLDTLDISGTCITGRGCRLMVLRLPHLAWLTHCPFNCNSDTLIFESRAELFSYIKDQLTRQPVLMISNQNLATTTSEVDGHNEETPTSSEVKASTDIAGTTNQNTPHQEPFTLKLKSFWLFNTTSEEMLLTNLCPQLEHLRLDFVMQDLTEIPNVESIRQLSHLRNLSLYTFDQCPIALVTSIIEFAPRLTTLHLHLGDEWFFVAPIVNVIAECCHNLTSLTMEGDYKGQHSLEDSDARLDFALPPEGLVHLEEARIDGCVADARLLHLLTQAPKLRTLRLDGELEWLHDDTITNAINQNLLLEIEELWFNVSAGITFSSVRRLLLSTNNLQRVGRLCLMSSATKDTYQDLLRLSRNLNLATELIWVTDQREIIPLIAPV